MCRVTNDNYTTILQRAATLIPNTKGHSKWSGLSDFFPGDDLLYSRRPAFRPPGLLRSSKCSGHFSHMSHVQVGIVRAIKTKKASHKGGFSF